MKIESEITGHVKIHTSSRLQIELWIKDAQVDFFTLDLEKETVLIHVEKSTRALLGMRRVYEDYIKLIADLGLEMPSKLNDVANVTIRRVYKSLEEIKER